jgi:hypothetical protein
MKVARQLSLGRDEISTWRMKTVQSSKVSIFCSYGESNDDKALCWLRSGISTAPTSSEPNLLLSAGMSTHQKAPMAEGKLQSDPDYRSNQREAQRAWQESHPGYWRQYRNAHQNMQNAAPIHNGPGQLEAGTV